MGTINYGHNDIFNIGINPDNYIDEYEKETDINFLWDEITEELERYNFNAFSVSAEPGYYEGFYIKINFDWLYFDDHIEKLETQKEITQLKRFLEFCVYWDLVQYHPGWCTSYENEKETEKALKQAIKELRQNIKAIPTYRNYRKAIPTYSNYRKEVLS